MEIKRSNIKLDNFKTLAINFATVPSKQKLSKENLKNNPVDLDFRILKNKKNKSKVKIILELNSNNIKAPLPGYIFSIVCESEYSIKGLGKMEPDMQNKHILYTTIPLAISMVRSHLFNVSANFPHGHYLLPSIDLIDLFNKKFSKEAKSKK